MANDLSNKFNVWVEAIRMLRIMFHGDEVSGPPEL